MNAPGNRATNPAPPRLPPLRLRQKAALITLGVLAGLGICEAACRICGLGQTTPAADYIANWETQWGADFYTLDPRFPPSGDFLNIDGLRDRQHDLTKPPGTTRIACLGDSVTFGFLVDHTNSYPSRLEASLAESGIKAEVFNIALPGWSIRQQRIARKYHPDLVILGVCLNDIPEMQNNLLKPPAPWLANLYRRSQLLRAIYRPQEREIGNVEELFIAPDAPNVLRGWERYLHELDGLAADLAESKIPALLVAFPFRFQLDSGHASPPPQERLRRRCSALGINFADPLPALRRAGPDAFLDHDHLSPDGAEIVARYLEKPARTALRR